MLFNFCDPRLRPEIECSTVSTEGYEVSNLISDSGKGFLAYASIKPPINIDITFLYNSVPALGRIEVWGNVASRCGRDTLASISTLWYKHELNKSMTIEREQCNKHFSASKSIEDSKNILPSVTNTSFKEVLELSLDVPESFLDAITWEIMTQPILLPSGKIIDQSTLQKHEETEALWGRKLTDPFTGIPFSENRKPVIASALKVRIDKFLLENSNAEEVKRLPRVLGRRLSSSTIEHKTTEIPKYLLGENVFNKTSNNPKPKLHCSATDIQGNKKFCHKLPVAVMSHKRTATTVPKVIKKRKIIEPPETFLKDVKDEAKNICATNSASIDINSKLSHLKCLDNSPEQDSASYKLSCTCCPNGIFYQLPCKHVLCRKLLTSIQNSQCTSCGSVYKNSEIKRVYE
ncbi:RING finger protein 37 isoform X2 [Nomia melanderi]|uniref:RING finger protein 37 isoform X2 n=1 Tax=Nomia melanderi TaxID=2448451 RepID=UPI001304064C|nr:RING finger protein 37 isoform X2 [Nomia melanderi]